MATQHVLHARETLGISPHRQMVARRGWSRDRMAARRNANAGVMARIRRYLIALRRAGRRAILIVDVDCGDGRRLIDAAAEAHALGFVAIEARGFDISPEKVAAAAETADGRGDPAVRFSFAVLDERAPFSLDDDEDGQADLMLANAHRSAAEISHAIDRDGILIHHR